MVMSVSSWCQYTDSIYINMTVPGSFEVDYGFIHFRINLSGWMVADLTIVNDTLCQYIFPPMIPGTVINYWLEAINSDLDTIKDPPPDAPYDYYTIHVGGPLEVNIWQIQSVPHNWDRSLFEGDTVRVSGIVTRRNQLSPAADFYMAMPNGGPFSGIYVYDPGGCIPTLYSGDSLTIVGIVREFGGLDHPSYYGYNTELEILPGGLTFDSYGHPLPRIETINAISIDTTENADSSGEQWEGVYIRINDIIVDSVIEHTYASRWQCHDSTGHFILYVYPEAVDSIPSVGTEFTYVQGIVVPRYGNYEMRALYEFDICRNMTSIDESTSLPIRAVLYQNYPNPFNDATTIEFTTPIDCWSTLIVYDILGRQRKKLVWDNLPKGRHSITLDCKDLSAGLYVYQLQTPNYTQTKRLVLLK